MLMMKVYNIYVHIFIYFWLEYAKSVSPNQPYCLSVTRGSECDEKLQHQRSLQEREILFTNISNCPSISCLTLRIFKRIVNTMYAHRFQRSKQSNTRKRKGWMEINLSKQSEVWSTSITIQSM